MAAVSIGFWILVWLAGLSALLWLAKERLVPAVESRTQAAVGSVLGGINDTPVEVSVNGHTTRLSGTIHHEAQRLTLIEAALQVNGVREVIDALALAAPAAAGADDASAPPARPLPREASRPTQAGNTQTGSSSTARLGALPADAFTLNASGDSALTPHRRVDDMPRTTVFGAILPPWRAPATFSRQVAELPTDTTALPVPGAPAAETAKTDLPDDGEPVGNERDTVSPEAGESEAGESERGEPETGESVAGEPDTDPPRLDEPQAVAGPDTIRDALGTERLQQRFESLISAPIAFRTGSDDLTVDSLRILDELATLMSAHKSVKLDIGGHTDAAGKERDNLFLSQARSNRVRDYLATRGVSPYRMLAHGYGESLPIASNDNAEGRAANRRIEFRLR